VSVQNVASRSESVSTTTFKLEPTCRHVYSRTRSYSVSRNSRKQPALSVEEHTAVAAELYRIRAKLSAMLPAFNRLPKNDRSMRSYVKLIDILTRLRSDLDDRFGADHPREYDARCYYPNVGAPAIIRTEKAETP
jgi:hypothetical protein